jgi:hypothetical protein
MMGIVEITRPTSCAPTAALKVAPLTKTRVMKRFIGSPKNNNLLSQRFGKHGG